MLCAAPCGRTAYIIDSVIFFNLLYKYKYIYIFIYLQKKIINLNDILFIIPMIAQKLVFTSFYSI
ncbi:hypothetical protein GLOIN_2v1664129 [Rhizophagus irregularis DAOM 181602=DAOM 197198]|uniref:Uncharacterized protein n=1 Tax=Rhizophagus irregularis (strain DAOM 181602 / DAOM 197198 / MUCL 43194) TaxID=747089 RepID=A0A2P4PJT7_RHIID|nr:hypothetical protein GLOIN_2v1664129 [Rhizophagus irregularis DAOM 181602=DAOM 197198]POG65645.1 hypothetical protein GLOIN_2v1664129 [Rhizophagus irregularis DAOM 181602=DAOM 197198]|eukprot:XP_025172511.1 hypothetical protein GLOIN_2v1664129 [Rhizophagus irregularis DAOM 181602=DAOM 197198]